MSATQVQERPVRACSLAPAPTPAAPARNEARGFERDPGLPARHEAKYLVEPERLPDMRRFLAAFCRPDPHGRGERPCYRVTTLQLDRHDLTLLRAAERDALHRFKLRIRRYGEGPLVPGETLHLEIKRKLGRHVIKSRARVPAETFGESICRRIDPALRFASARERKVYETFVRLTRALEARPVVVNGYVREAYLGQRETYARVTFDTRLVYRTTQAWRVWDGPLRWRRMDGAQAFGGERSLAVLELKCEDQAPGWMADLVRRFGLRRGAFCKYAAAMRQEWSFAP